MFGGFTAKGDLLCDPGKLVLEEVAGGVGPFARPVRLAAAEIMRRRSDGAWWSAWRLAREGGYGLYEGPQQPEETCVSWMSWLVSVSNGAGLATRPGTFGKVKVLPDAGEVGLHGSPRTSSFRRPSVETWHRRPPDEELPTLSAPSTEPRDPEEDANPPLG
ncbi:hypothetical protein GCM10010383_67930 [Streptomyces lomondensis]|uniref:Uncharacterized protein n=1 Tax=Streptomyces lomondensis TaxID=68229 RepID=A0ABQ2XPY1_9ACTN|nr:hypothetical protein GCM10010383_67930 [Streptomyces lomondensis]